MGRKPKSFYEGQAKLAAGKKKYYLGLPADCPFASMTVGGYTFQKFSERIDRSSKDGHMYTGRYRQPGSIAFLDDADIEKIKIASEKCVVRMTGHEAPFAQKLHKDTYGFYSLPDDIPVLKFLKFTVARDQEVPAV